MALVAEADHEAEEAEEQDNMLQVQLYRDR